MGITIGITGAIGSGKTTFADLLTTLEPSHAIYEGSGVIMEVADDFNHALSGELAFETTTKPVELANQTFVWFIEAIAEKLHRDVTWNQLAITPHQLAAHPELFAKMFVYIEAAKQQPSLLETPITTANKEIYRPLLQWLGGYLTAKVSPTIWFDEIFRRIGLHDSDKNLVIVSGLRYPSNAEVVRSNGGIIIGIERPLAENDLQDPTEASRHEIVPDILLLNNGTLSQLEAAAEKLWYDLSIGKPAKHYEAAPAKL